MRKTNLRRALSSFLILIFLFTQSGGAMPWLGYSEARAAADISVLDGRILFAQNLYDNAVEGTAVGQYEAGSKAELQTAINVAKSRKTNFPNNQAVIDAAVINLNLAITAFNARMVTEEQADTTKPIIVLLGSTPVTVVVGTSYTDAGATASDNKDGDITSKIQTANTANTAVVGAYAVTYNVKDAANNEAVPVVRTVNVIEKQTSGGEGGGGTAFIPVKFSPADASVIINSGNDKTANRSVALALKAASATIMAISNIPTFADSSWETFREGVEWNLTEGNGKKTVYAKFKSASGSESAVYTDTVILEENMSGDDDSAGQVLGENTVGIYNGDLIQCKSSADSNAVYVVKITGNRKFIRQIKSDFFKYYSHLKWSDVKQVGSLNEYVTSRWIRINTGANGIATKTDRVYEINGDWTKHWLDITKEQFYARGGSEAAIFGVNSGEMDSYTTGANVRAS